MGQLETTMLAPPEPPAGILDAEIHPHDGTATLESAIDAATALPHTWDDLHPRVSVRNHRTGKDIWIARRGIAGLSERFAVVEDMVTTTRGFLRRTAPGAFSGKWLAAWMFTGGAAVWGFTTVRRFHRIDLRESTIHVDGVVYELDRVRDVAIGTNGIEIVTTDGVVAIRPHNVPESISRELVQLIRDHIGPHRGSARR